jgi:hypothetical protein
MVVRTFFSESKYKRRRLVCQRNIDQKIRCVKCVCYELMYGIFCMFENLRSPGRYKCPLISNNHRTNAAYFIRYTVSCLKSSLYL